GDRCLFWVMDEETVKCRVPFDNISSIQLKTKKDQNSTYRYIAIQLNDLRRKDTLVDRKTVKTFQDGHECDVAIFDEYVIPLEKLYKMLRGKCKAARE